MDMEIDRARLNAFSVGVALYRPEIPQNTGNIGRLCVGTGSELFIIGTPSFLLRAKEVRRAGLDYWEHLRLTKIPTFPLFDETRGARRVVVVSTKGRVPYYSFDYRTDDILLFGRESDGLPHEAWSAYVDISVTIPMREEVRSQNLANSVAVVLYEALRRHMTR